MRIWIARDWYKIMAFLTPPKLVKNDSRTEWYGYREPALENFIPQEILDTIKLNECIECEMTINIVKKQN